MKILFILVSVCLCCIGLFAEKFSSADCRWSFIEQPLSHFERGNKGTYKQRLCIYDGFYKPNQSLPIFLYTGNESPVEEYVNNTGLMWSLAEKMQALVVFAEHRYFGESIPNLKGTPDCMAYLTSEEALADYASLSNMIRRDTVEWGAAQSAIVAFGGSYGGMLASWMRTLYPSAVDGAISASAPVWGFPLNSCPLDGSSQVVSYATSAAAGSSPRCSSNLKASYVLFSDLGKQDWGRQLLNEQLPLCSPLHTAVDVTSLLTYLQSPLFNLAEGSYPFPSNYITYALTGSSDALLPAWAMQVMCEKVSEDYGIAITGSEDTVQFTVSDTTGKVSVQVDWDQLTNNGYTAENVVSDTRIVDLLTAALNSIQVWYNVSGTLPSCINWDNTAPHSLRSSKMGNDNNTVRRRHSKIPGKASDISYINQAAVSSSPYASSASSSSICTVESADLDSLTAWDVLTCNEGINLVNWRVQGAGQGDKLYWPPNVPRDYSRSSMIPGSLSYCAYYKSIGLYGIPEKPDDWSLWLDTAYGGMRNWYTSNIVYSNGDLDPWMPAGVNMHVYGASTNIRNQSSAMHSSNNNNNNNNSNNNNNNNNNLYSLLIKQGGHHLDLFWETETDPESVREVRAFEEQQIRQWVDARKNLVVKIQGN